MKATQARMKALFAEYGQVAIWIHVGGFATVMTGFTVAIGTGLAIESTAASGGTLVAAYLATKATSPLRIAFTLVSTPVVGSRFRRPMPDPEITPPGP